MVINDEAHHCYREKPDARREDALKGDEKKEAEKNNEAARLWITGFEAVNRKLGVAKVVDLSATPFFLRGSGYAEGTLFPWTMSDFSLMDAIECGIVKLPRVPVADNIPGGEMPKFRNLWEHIRTRMPKKGRGARSQARPAEPADRAANGALKRCTVTTRRPSSCGSSRWHQGAAVLHRGVQQHVHVQAGLRLHLGLQARPTRTAVPPTSPAPGTVPQHRRVRQPLGRPRTLLIDSEQLESGDALDDSFRASSRRP
jgi:type III restriction enzyme